MPASPLQVKRRLSSKFLSLGLAGSLLLALLTLGVSALEMTWLENDTLAIADDSQQSTYYLFDIDEQLARLRSQLALGLHGSADDFVKDAAIITQINNRLRTALAALPSTLESSVGQEQWGSLRPDILRLKERYAQVALAIQAGHMDRASRLLARQAIAAAKVHDGLDGLQKMHRQAVLARLRAAHRRTAYLQVLELGLTLAFVAGMVAIWLWVLRTLRYKRHLIAEYADQLETANADLDAFAGRAAHDLRNAFASIAMGSQLLRTSAGSPAQTMKIADRMERSSRQSIQLIEALLAFSRSQAVEGEESAGLQSVLTSVLEELQPQIEQLDVAVSADDVPDIYVRCAPGLLHTVLLNLCGNAVKFLEGRPERRVRIAANSADSWCRIDVEDTGPGIPAEARTRIFDPFYRVANTQAPGSGIGLATVRRIVEARGGRIVVEPTEEGGSRFRLWLPLAEVSAR